MEEDEKKLSELKASPDKKVVYFNTSELSYEEALQLIAEWWERIRDDGINVAAEIQRRRTELRKPGPDAGTLADRHG